MIVGEIAELEAEISQALDAHPDGEIFRSFFRSRESVICAATLLAEIGDCRARYPHRDAIAADGGQAPVAKESGKRKTPPSDGRLTSGCATRSPRSRTTPACGTRGPLRATPRPEPAGTTTVELYAL